MALPFEGRVLLVVKEAVTPFCRSSELSLVSPIQARTIVDQACLSLIRKFAIPDPGSNQKEVGKKLIETSLLFNFISRNE